MHPLVKGLVAIAFLTVATTFTFLSLSPHVPLMMAGLAAAGVTYGFGAILFVLGRERMLRDMPLSPFVLGVLSPGVAVVFLGYAAASAMQRPQLIVYPQEMCDMLKDAYAEAAPGEVNCTYKAYLFRAEGGGYYTYGVSENAKGECRYVDASLVDVRTLKPDFDLPTLSELPLECATQLSNVYETFPPRRW